MRELSSHLAGLQHHMTNHRMAKSTRALALLGALSTVSGAWLLPWATATAQTFPVTAAERATADSVAQAGVPLSALADNAPDHYVVQTGDTLWAISKLYLKTPWRWTELWGMNRADIANPHRIYPGQTLILVRGGERASLRMGNQGSDNAADGANANANDNPSTTDIVRLSPRTRSTSLLAGPLPALRSSAIEPFLAEPLIIEPNELEAAPQIVAGKLSRQVMSSDDRIYAIGPIGAPLLDEQPREKHFRIYGAAVPLRHPDTNEVLGYEASFEGTATLVKGEHHSTATDAEGKVTDTIVAASLDITASKGEINLGDRLLPEIPFQIQTYTPHAPAQQIESRVVSVYGTAVTNAAQNQVVSIIGGTLDGIDVGTVLAILKNGVQVPPNGNGNGNGNSGSNQNKNVQIMLPDERIGLLMVFRTFSHLSYGLILEITDGVTVGDRLVSP